MGHVGIRVELQGLAHLGDRFGITSRHIIGVAEIHVDREGEWIEFQGAFVFGDGPIVIANAFQNRIAKPVMRGRVIRVKGDGFFEFLD